jgi:Fe-S-cluster-containing dehydrogenase component
MAKYSILVDLSSCLGCKSCAQSCRYENKVSPGVSWLKVEDEVLSNAKGPELYTFPMACLHCGEPSCAKVCPVRAISKQPDGTVQRDEAQCVGCKYCVSACPFGQSHFNELLKKAEKCTLCKDRQDRGEVPACTVNCPTGARSAVESNKLQTEANNRIALAKKMGLDYTLYSGDKVGGTHVAYVVPKGVQIESGPQGKGPSPTIGVWQGVVKPVAKVGLGAVVGAVAIAGLSNSRKKEDN